MFLFDDNRNYFSITQTHTFNSLKMYPLFYGMKQICKWYSITLGARKTKRFRIQMYVIAE